MSFLTVLKEASEATLEAISFLQHTNSIHELLKDYTGNKRTINYIDHKTIRDLTLSENTNDIDWVEPAVDRLNIANFTMDVQSNNVQYDEAISNFFSLLIPKQLHDQQDIIDIFLDAVTTWTVAEKRWPIDKHTTYVVNIIKDRLEENLEGQSPSLCQRTLNAFDARYKDLDSTALDVSILNSNERMKTTWFKVLPMVLKAIDEKHNTSLYPMPDSRPAPHYQRSHRRHTNNSSSMSTSRYYISPPSSSSSGASHYLSPLGKINRLLQKSDNRTSLHEDDNEIPDEPQTSGMKRSHDQQKADVATIDKRRRPAPVVISEVSEDDHEESQESSSEDTYDDTLVSNPHCGYDSDASVSRENDHSSSEQQRPLNPVSLISTSTILNPDRDEPISASNVSQKKGQHAVATDRVTRASSRLRVSGSSYARRQDDQGNNPSSTSVAPVPSSGKLPRRRPSSGKSTKLPKRCQHWGKRELMALEKGIQLHGKEWARIQAARKILRGRTPKQIYDKARRIAIQRERDGQPLGPFTCMLPSH